MAALPKPERRSQELNKHDSIGFLAKDLIASLRDGHTLDELSVLLAEEGVRMTPVALKSHLRRIRRRIPKRSNAAKPPRKTEEEITDVTANNSRQSDGVLVSTSARVSGTPDRPSTAGVGTGFLPPPRLPLTQAIPRVPGKDSDHL